MADVDEDVITRPGASADETDLTDETQDFRFLASISREDAAIPKRGEKDFEHHATALQSNTLAASRQAMHNALAFQRTHLPKSLTTATYHPETNMAYVYDPKGPLYQRLGRMIPTQDDPLGNDGLPARPMWLLPEEILYLMERGSLDVRWPTVEGDDGAVGLPMSLQGAYAMLIGDEESHRGTLTLERYSVYTSLKRMGYTVLRAPSWNGPGPPMTSECFAPSPRRAWHVGLFHGLFDYYFAWWGAVVTSPDQPEIAEQASGPLANRKMYRSYAEVYRRLALVNYHDPTTQYQRYSPGWPITADPSFRVTYHVWKPGSPTYKKTSPGPPDFRIAVIDARESSVPTLEDLGALLETVPYSPPLESAPFSQKLKNGYKNVILAIVDQGVVSYLRVSDAAFGREKLYERKGRGPGAKRGGRGGRGRGRGR